MEIVNYYINTVSNAGTKLGPILIICIIGYFFFFKAPFSFKSKKVLEKKEDRPKEPVLEIKKPTLIEVKAQPQDDDYQERLNKAREEKERQKKQREQEEREKQKKQREQERKNAVKPSFAEELFEMAAGQSLTKKELKKRYHDLIKKNHPDKVASLGADFKTLAEKKTKEINSAYDELKKKAS